MRCCTISLPVDVELISMGFVSSSSCAPPADCNTAWNHTDYRLCHSPWERSLECTHTQPLILLTPWPPCRSPKISALPDRFLIPLAAMQHRGDPDPDTHRTRIHPHAQCIIPAVVLVRTILFIICAPADAADIQQHQRCVSPQRWGYVPASALRKETREDDGREDKHVNFKMIRLFISLQPSAGGCAAQPKLVIPPVLITLKRRQFILQMFISVEWSVHTLQTDRLADRTNI